MIWEFKGSVAPFQTLALMVVGEDPVVWRRTFSVSPGVWVSPATVTAGWTSCISPPPVALRSSSAVTTPLDWMRTFV